MQRNPPRFGDLLQSPTLAVALGFGTGLSPIVPGTVGTLVALPLWWMMIGFHPFYYLAFVAGAFLLGLWICGRASTRLGQHDPSAIVFDEIVGYLLALIVVPPTLSGVIFSFVVFRIFDVVKPWPISWLDRHVEGGLGIMLDDLVAGLFTAIIVLAARLVGVV